MRIAPIVAGLVAVDLCGCQNFSKLDSCLVVPDMRDGHKLVPNPPIEKYSEPLVLSATISPSSSRQVVASVTR